MFEVLTVGEQTIAPVPSTPLSVSETAVHSKQDGMDHGS
jgi:hypothetical protein